MKIINTPAVYLLGKQVIDQGELDRFLGDHEVQWTTDSEVASEVLCETAGRLCYMSFAKPRPGGNHRYLEHIKEVGHGSVLEHAVFNLMITGVSRTLTHELVRHRSGFGYSQLSQRYVDESVAEYVAPPELAKEIAEADSRDSFVLGFMAEGDGTAEDALAAYRKAYPDASDADYEIGKIWLDSVQQSHVAYQKLSDALFIKAYNRNYPQESLRTLADVRAAMLRTKPEITTDIRKTARQAARSVLPNCTETKIFVTANARALRHFIEQRGSRHAEPEIRRLAAMVLKIVQSEAPNLFGDYVAQLDGTGEVRDIVTDYRKV